MVFHADRVRDLEIAGVVSSRAYGKDIYFQSTVPGKHDSIIICMMRTEGSAVNRPRRFLAAHNGRRPAARVRAGCHTSVEVLFEKSSLYLIRYMVTVRRHA
jgi:hypothetical protein